MDLIMSGRLPPPPNHVVIVLGIDFSKKGLSARIVSCLDKPSKKSVSKYEVVGIDI